MDRGHYINIVGIHGDQTSGRDAHRNCGFGLWHRKFLLLFENMLRSLGKRYACVTIPYWNYFEDSKLFFEQRCGSLRECSPILNELGGPSRQWKRVTIYGATRNSRLCSNDPPMNHFCESQSRRGSQCARCIPRGRWNGPFPEITYIDLAAAIMTKGGYNESYDSTTTSPHVRQSTGFALSNFRMEVGFHSKLRSRCVH